MQLLATSGNEHVDVILCQAVLRTEAALPGRVSGYYLVGSYAAGCPVWTSDIDMVALIRGEPTAEEHAQFADMLAALRSQHRWTIDITLVNEEGLRRNGATRFKLVSRLLWGEDVRDLLPLRPIDAYIRSEMPGPLTIVFRTRGNPKTLLVPIGAPNPNHEFLGYTERMLQIPGGSQVRCTKELLLSNVLIGSALVALLARQYVHHKSMLPALYRAHIGDEWSDLVETIYQWCRDVWAYLVPEVAAERELLRELCVRELAFENYFLGVYRAFYTAELESADATRRDAARKRLAQFVWPAAQS